MPATNGNGDNGSHDEAPADILNIPITTATQLVHVPPGHTVLVVPIDELKTFVRALSREWIAPGPLAFFRRLIGHVDTLEE